MAGKGSVAGRYLKNAVLAVIASCLAIVVASALLTQREVHTHTLAYRLVPDQGQAEADALRTAVALISRRAATLGKSLGVRDCTVSAEPQGRLKLSFRAHPDAAEALLWLTMPGRVELHLVHPDQDILSATPPGELPAGYEVRCYQEQLYQLSRPGALATREHRYLVCTEPAMRVSRFKQVRLDTAGLYKTTVLTFAFEEGERERFRDLTALNVGRHMVMLVDGTLFFPSSQIQSAIEGGVVQVQGYFYNPPLRKLVGVLNASPLPGRLEELSHLIE